jgi:Trypsin-like peptidase domain/WD domain, G-beta repeat
VNADLIRSIVRILDPAGKTCGTGFVITSDGLIATCSHVVQGCDSQKRGEPRPGKVNVIFRITGEPGVALVEGDWWRPCEAEDVAILRVVGDLPGQVKPLPLGSSEGTDRHEFDTFGFPRSNPVQGLWGDGHILKETKLPVVPVLQLSSTQVTRGFSGAPVLDRLRKRVVGMVTSITKPDEYGRLPETAFITPTEILRAICPALELSDVCPYRNLEAFAEADAAFFFGRKRVIEALVEKLAHERRFLAIFGPSGCGKSSVVQAGLIPALRKGAVVGSDQWNIFVSRPTDHSFKQQVVDLKHAAKQVAMVIDQFEELFVSYNETAREEVITQLTSILNGSAHLTLIVVIRDDFFSLATQHENLAQWIGRNQYSIPPTIKPDELGDIVREPADTIGWQFEPGLIETIVNDALEIAPQGREKGARSTILPLLEFALTELWNRRQDGMFIRSAYNRLHGVTGGLSLWADDIYDSFSERQRLLVQRIFSDLVHLGDESQHIPDSRRCRALTSLVRNAGEKADVYQVVKRLVDKRLLVMSHDTESNKETVEIIHDALLREWGLLQRWLKEDRRFLLWHQKLEERLREWKETNPDDPTKPDEERLLRGQDLAVAEDMVHKRGDDLTAMQREYILASQKQMTDELEKERQRTTELSAALETAQRQKQMALARGLAAQAVLYSQYDHDLNLIERSILLAIESLRRFPSPEADQALREGGALLHRCLGVLEHGDVVNAVAFSPNGELVATASDDQTAGVWEVSSGKRVARLGHEDWVNAVAFSPDGRLVATASDDRTARVWEVGSSQQLVRLLHEDRVRGVAFSPDGKYLATASGNMVEIWLWRLEDLIAAVKPKLMRNLTQEEWKQFLGDEPYRKTFEDLP